MRLLSSTIQQKLDELKPEYLSGKYDEVLEKSDNLLKEELSEKERIEILILKSRCYWFLQQRDKEPKHRFTGLEIAIDAYNRSKKLENKLLLFESTYWSMLLYTITHHSKEVLDLFKEIKSVFAELEKSHPKYKNFREVMFITMNSVNSSNSNLLEGKPRPDTWENNHQKSIKAVSLCEQDDDPDDPIYLELMLRSYWSLGISWGDSGNYEKASEFYEKALEIADRIKNVFWRTKIMTSISYIHWHKGEFDEFLDMASEILEISKSIGNKRGIAASNAQIAKYHFETGELKKMLKYSLNAYNIISDGGKKENVVDFLDHVGIAYAGLGELDKAEEIHEKILKFSIENNWEWNIYSQKENLSGIYLSKGELDKAIEFVEEAGEYYEKQGLKFDFAWNTFNQHFPYLKKGLVKEAIQRLEKSVVLFKELENLPRAANSLFHIVNITSQHNMKEQAENYLIELKETMKKIDHPKIKRLLLIAEGVMLKNSKNTRDRIRAEVLFDQLLLEDLGYHFNIELLFNQCDLLLSVLKQTGDEKILIKLQEHIDLLVEKSTKNNIIDLIIESMWFKSQLLLLEGDLENAKENLSQALILAEEKGYRNLALKISSSKDQVLTLIVNKKDTEAPGLSLKDKLTTLKLVEGFDEVKKTKTFDLSELKLKADI